MGTLVTALATFLPCFLFTVILAPSLKKMAKNQSIKAFVEGITATVIEALVGSVIFIGTRSIIDILTALIAIVTMFALIYTKKLQEPHVIILAAIAGMIIKAFNNFFI